MVRVFEENKYSTDVETISFATNSEEVKDILYSEDIEGKSGNYWGDQAYVEKYIPVVWGGKFESKTEKWCSITDLESEGWFFEVDEINEVVIVTNQYETEYELGFGDFGWFKYIEEF